MDKFLLKTVSNWKFQWIMKIYDNCLNRNFTQIRKHFRQIYKRKKQNKIFNKIVTKINSLGKQKFTKIGLKTNYINRNLSKLFIAMHGFFGVIESIQYTHLLIEVSMFSFGAYKYYK